MTSTPLSPDGDGIDLEATLALLDAYEAAAVRYGMAVTMRADDKFVPKDRQSSPQTLDSEDLSLNAARAACRSALPSLLARQRSRSDEVVTAIHAVVTDRFCDRKGDPLWDAVYAHVAHVSSRSSTPGAAPDASTETAT